MTGPVYYVLLAAGIVACIVLFVVALLRPRDPKRKRAASPALAIAVAGAAVLTGFLISHSN